MTFMHVLTVTRVPSHTNEYNALILTLSNSIF
jgi:hypothetical protein